MSFSTNQSQPPPRPSLRAPLRTRWTVDPGIGLLDLTPVSLGGLAAVAGGPAVAGLQTADGEVVYRIDLAGDVVDLAATAQGPVVLHGGDTDLLEAFSWTGERLWEQPAPHEMGLRSLRGLSDRILALGLPRTADAATVCTIFSTDGERLAEYPSPGDLPDLVPRGTVSSVRSQIPSQAGLFLYDFAERRLLRLLADSHYLRAVAGSIAVIDNYDDGVTEPRVTAMDTATGETLWKGPGGPNLAFDADQQQVASVVGRQGEFAATLRDLRSGVPAWRSDPIQGRSATVQLVDQTVLVFVDRARLLVFERATGRLVQTLNERSSVVYGACPTGAGLIDCCFDELRCWSGAEQ